MKNINLIRKIAWNFHKSTGLDWDDLFQEACLSYLQALKTYDKKRGKVTTYVWYCIMSDLKDYEYKERCYKTPLCDLEEALSQSSNNVSFWDHIAVTIKEDVALILKSAEALDTIIHNYDKVERDERLMAKQFISSLLFREGKSRDEVRNVMMELKQAFTY